MRSLTKPIVSRSIIRTISKVLFAGLTMIGAAPAFAASSGAVPDLSVKIDAAGAALVAGSPTQLVIRVQNHSDVGGGDNRLVVPLAQGLQALTWTCAARAGSQCANASGSGSLNESLQGLNANSALEYVLQADVGASAPPFVDVSAQINLTGQARCASGETAPCRTSLSLASGPGVLLDIRSQAKALKPGEVVRYTITAHTVSTQSDAAGTVLRSPVPAGLINSNWRCRSAVGACGQASGQGSIDQTLGNFSTGSVSFDVIATVAADAPASIVQAAVAVPPYGGSCAIARNGTLTFRSAPCSARNVLATSANILISRSEDYLADASTISTRFVLDNNGSQADGSVVDAVLGVGVSHLDWTCVGRGATCPQASGSGAIHQTIATWPASGRLVYDLVSKVASSSTSRAKNDLRVTPSARGICAASGDSGTCEALYSIPTDHAGLKLSQSVDDLGARAGDVVTYRINVGNAPSADPARDVVLYMAQPRGIDAFVSWTCSASVTSTTACPRSSGAGALREMFAQLAPSSDLNYVIQARVGAHPPATISGRATLTSPASTGLGCGASDATSHACVTSSQFSTVPVIALDQSMSADTLAPGSMVDYFLDVFNLGASADLVKVRNFLPTGLSNASWVCADLGMGCPVASGTGSVVAKLTQMPTGSGVRYHVSAEVDGTQPQSASSVLTAVPSSGGRCQDSAGSSIGSAPCIDRITSSFEPKIELTQTSSEHQLLRGGVIHHALIVKNLGAPALNTRLALPMAAGISRSDWTCDGFGGATCPQIAGVGGISTQIANLPFNAYLRYSIRSFLTNDAPATISSIATTTPGAKTLCADTGCTSTLSLPVTEVPAANLQVTVSNSAKSAQSGATLNWDVDVRNLGTESSAAFSLSSVLAGSGVTINSWTCSGTECPAAEGSGPIQQGVASLSVYDSSNDEKASAPGKLHFVINGSHTSNSVTGNSLAIKLTPSGGDTCSPASCLADSRVADAPLGLQPISLSMTSNDFEVLPNSSFTYEFGVNFSSFGSLPPVSVYSVDPVGVVSSSWTCVANSNATCPNPASGTGPIDSVISLVGDGAVVFTVVAITGPTIPSEMEFSAGASPGSFYCVPDSCMVSLLVPNGQEELDLSLTADLEVVQPGDTVNYTFDVFNNGASVGGIVVDGFDSPSFAFSSWTCQDVKGGSCGAGSGPLMDTISYLESGFSQTYTITANVGDVLPPSIDYRVSVSPLPPQPDSPLGSFNCIPASCDASLALQTASPTVVLTMDAETGGVGGGTTYMHFVYTISNPGPADVEGISVYGIDDPNFPSSSWTCAGTGAMCAPSGSGQLQDFIEVLPANSSVTYTVDPGFTAFPTPITTYTGGAASGQGSSFSCTPVSCSVSRTFGGPSSPAEFAITKTANRSALTPGGNVRYTVTLANTGSVDSGPIQFIDAIPNGLTAFNWTCAASGDFVCEQTSGSGSLNENFGSFPQGASVTYTVDARVSSGASGSVINKAALSGDNIQCNPTNCQAVSSLPVTPPADIVISKSASPAAGSTVNPGAPISWTISALNSGGPTTATLTLRDVLPISLSAISVTTGQGVVCDSLTPTPGSVLVCSIAAGFTGQSSVSIAATVAPGATGAVVNSVTATGVNGIACNSCSVSNPIAQIIDLALMNARPFVAGGISGTLIDVVNLSDIASAGSTVSVSPASALRLTSPFSSECTAVTGADGEVSVICQSPPETEGISCLSGGCVLGAIAPGAAMTFFVALDGSSAATVQLSALGDPDTSNNTIVLPAVGAP